MSKASFFKHAKSIGLKANDNFAYMLKDESNNSICAGDNISVAFYYEKGRVRMCYHYGTVDLKTGNINIQPNRFFESTKVNMTKLKDHLDRMTEAFDRLVDEKAMFPDNLKDSLKDMMI